MTASALVALSGAHDTTSAVDSERLSSDEGGVVRGEECDRLGHFHYLPRTAQGVCCFAVLQKLSEGEGQSYAE